MAEWLSTWKKNGMKTSSGATPANLDIILDFDEQIKSFEKLGFRIGFKHVLRDRNGLADVLAKRAAEVDKKLKRGVSKDRAINAVCKDSSELDALEFSLPFGKI
ncbi:hypothetical protein IWZ01DRAFT_480819 [Phyllosticta capitalensis]